MSDNEQVVGKSTPLLASNSFSEDEQAWELLDSLPAWAINKRILTLNRPPHPEASIREHRSCQDLRSGKFKLDDTFKLPVIKDVAGPAVLWGLACLLCQSYFFAVIPIVQIYVSDCDVLAQDQRNTSSTKVLDVRRNATLLYKQETYAKLPDILMWAAFFLPAMFGILFGQAVTLRYVTLPLFRNYKRQDGFFQYLPIIGTWGWVRKLGYSSWYVVQMVITALTYTDNMTNAVFTARILATWQLGDKCTKYSQIQKYWYETWCASMFGPFVHWIGPDIFDFFYVVLLAYLAQLLVQPLYALYLTFPAHYLRGICGSCTSRVGWLMRLLSCRWSKGQGIGPALDLRPSFDLVRSTSMNKSTRYARQGFREGAPVKVFENDEDGHRQYDATVVRIDAENDRLQVKTPRFERMVSPTLWVPTQNVCPTRNSVVLDMVQEIQEDAVGPWAIVWHTKTEREHVFTEGKLFGDRQKAKEAWDERCTQPEEACWYFYHCVLEVHGADSTKIRLALDDWNLENNSDQHLFGYKTLENRASATDLTSYESALFILAEANRMEALTAQSMAYIDGREKVLHEAVAQEGDRPGEITQEYVELIRFLACRASMVFGMKGLLQNGILLNLQGSFLAIEKVVDGEVDFFTTVTTIFTVLCILMDGFEMISLRLLVKQMMEHYQSSGRADRIPKFRRLACVHREIDIMFTVFVIFGLYALIKLCAVIGCKDGVFNLGTGCLDIHHLNRTKPECTL